MHAHTCPNAVIYTTYFGFIPKPLARASCSFWPALSGGQLLMPQSGAESLQCIFGAR